MQYVSSLFAHISIAIADNDALALILSSKCNGGDGTQRFVARSFQNTIMDGYSVTVDRSVHIRSVNDVNVAISAANAKI
jgi:hypothetical protein